MWMVELYKQANNKEVTYWVFPTVQAMCWIVPSSLTKVVLVVPFYIGRNSRPGEAPQAVVQDSNIGPADSKPILKRWSAVRARHCVSYWWYRDDQHWALRVPELGKLRGGGRDLCATTVWHGKCMRVPAERRGRLLTEECLRERLGLLIVYREERWVKKERVLKLWKNIF